MKYIKLFRKIFKILQLKATHTHTHTLNRWIFIDETYM